eukprot:jgi/Chlat1/9013/Chrsp94S08343
MCSTSWPTWSAWRRFDTFGADIPLNLLSFNGTGFGEAIGGSPGLKRWHWTSKAMYEIGAAEDKGSMLLMSNPGLADAASGLACSASYQSAVDRQLQWDCRNYTIEESACVRGVEPPQRPRRPLNDDQGLYNFDTNIAVPTLKINNVPTDIRGLTFSRTPKQVLNILLMESTNGTCGFFPQGVNGKINNTISFANQANGFAGYSGNRRLTLSQAGKANLLNENIIIPVPAAEAVQLEASGAEYGPSFNITNLGTGLPIGPYENVIVPQSP